MSVSPDDTEAPDGPDLLVQHLRSISDLILGTTFSTAVYLRQQADQAEAGSPADRRQSVRNVLSLYAQGPGGFGDIQLQDANGMRLEQSELDRLRAELARVAFDELS